MSIAPALPTGYSFLDRVETDAKGNVFVSQILQNDIWVISPEGSQRVLIADKMNAPLDNNTSFVLKGYVLRTANLGFAHVKPAEADRKVVSMSGSPLHKEDSPSYLDVRFASERSKIA